MKDKKTGKFLSAVVMLLGVILLWFGLIYGSYDPENVRIVGILLAFVGCGMITVAALIFDYSKE